MNQLGFNTIPTRVALTKIPAALRNPIPVVLENFKRYGDPYGVRMGKQLSIVTSRPAIIQHFLQKNHRRYSKSDIQTKKLAMFLGKGLLTLDGEEWLKQRRIIQPGFHKQKILALKENMEATAEEVFEELASKVGRSAQTMDMKSFMMQMAFMMVSNALFSGAASTSQLVNIREAIESSQHALIKLVRLPFLEWMLRRTTVPNALKKVDQSCKDLLDLANTRRKTGAVGEGDLLDMLLGARYEDTGDLMTDQQLIFELLVLFVAGHETTANALSWSVFLLAQHPEVVERLRVEIETGKDDYLGQVINEVLRMYPPAWLTDRLSLEADEVDGIKIPAHTIMAGFIYGTHHHPDLWKQPERFNPDRFDKERKQEPYAFLPFGGGPRFCIGMQFALIEMQIVLRHLVTHFDIEIREPQLVKMKPLVTLGMSTDLPVVLKLRNL